MKHYRMAGNGLCALIASPAMPASAIMKRWRSRKIILAIALCGFSSASVACQRPNAPDVKGISGYTVVFVGEVTGVHLTSYEAYLLKSPGHNYYVGRTPDYAANVVVFEVLKGQPAPSIKLRLGGCSVRVPALKQRGIFFVRHDGVSAVAEWGTDRLSFWVSALAKARADP